MAQQVKNLPSNTEDKVDLGLIPGSGKSPGEGNAAHSRILAWRIPWTEEPGELPKIKSDAVSTVSPSISHEVMGSDAMIFIFWMLSFKTTFSLSSFLSHFS